MAWVLYVYVCDGEMRWLKKGDVIVGGGFGDLK